MLDNFLYMTNDDIECLHMYSYSKEHNGAKNQSEEKDDEDGHDNGIEEDGPS